MFFVSHAHLKKVLALVMAFAMAFTMMASAAYTDQADITATEAVDTLAALNVMTGDTDGSFRPNDTVTRAEMCRMIYTIRSGGNDDASSYAGMQTTFTDVGDSAWFSGYVKYCQSAGIVSGRSNTTFDPNADVTGIEAALMCLRVMGYDPTKANIGGSTWSTTTIALATENGLLDDVKATITVGLPRQYAAQIMYNMIDASTVKWSTDSDSYSSVGSDNTPNETVGKKYMGLNTVEGTLVSVTKEDGKSTYALSVEDITKYNGDSLSTSEQFDRNFTKVASDYSSLKNQKVKVLYKNTDEVYGVYALSEDNTTVAGVLGNYEKDGTKLKFDGTKYSVADSNEVKVDDSPVEDDILTYVDEAAGLSKAYDAKAISNTGSGKINLLDVQSFAVAKVTYVGSDYINISVKNKGEFSSLSSKLTDDNATWYDGIAKDDYIAITPDANTADGNMGITKLDIAEGKITSTKNSAGDDDYKVTISGSTYEQAMTAMNDVIGLNDTVAIVVKDGFFVWVDDANAVSDDVVLVIETGETNGVGSKWQADILFPDGTRETVELNSNTGLDGKTPTEIDAPFLASYTKSSGKYKLTTIDNNETAGYDEYSAVSTYTNNVDSNKMTAGGIKYISTDAVVFVKYTSSGDDAYKVVTGNAMRNWSSSREFASMALSKKSNGYQYAKIVFADMGQNGLPGGSGVQYAYIFDYTSVTEDGDDYIVYTAWNGEEEVELKTEDTTAYAEGTVVEYTTDSDGITSFDTVIKKGDWDVVGAVTGYDFADMDGSITIKGANSTMTAEIDTDEDCYVLFIDTDDGSGVANGEVQQAAENGDNYTPNAAVYRYGTTDQYIVVIDTANELDTSLFISGDVIVPID